MHSETIYCSLDLELTGFDPSVDEILEVGFVLFARRENELVVLERFGQVFKPAKQVRPKILALTGISEEEILAAPALSEFHEFLVQKLSGVTLVGHSISVDIRFLEANGITVEEAPIDTLDLVQFLLPTHHSYNLENLMHYFNIPHTEIHRALADADAVVAVVQKLLNLFSTLPLQTKERIHSLLAAHEIPWKRLLPLPEESRPQSPDMSVPKPATKNVYDSTPFRVEGDTDTVISAPLETNTVAQALASARGCSVPVLLVVGNKEAVLELYKQGLVYSEFLPGDLFNEQKFEEFVSKSSHDELAVRFILKILVWQATNWQTKTVQDINWAFSGKQFKPYITGNIVQHQSAEQIVCADYETLQYLVEHNFYTDRKLIIESMEYYEQFVTEASGTKVSWASFLTALRNLYNPESGLGAHELKEDVLKAITAVDLFFGLGILFFKQSSTSYIALAEVNPFDLGKLQRAAVNLERTFTLLNSEIYKAVKPLLLRLRLCLGEEGGYVRWVERGESHCTYYAWPESVAPRAIKWLQKFSGKVFITSLPSRELINYYSSRLGLETFNCTLVQTSPFSARTRLVERDLELHELLEDSVKPLPSIIAFNSQEALKAFYERYYTDLKQEASVFALGFTGGTNKLVKNFGLRERSILLATSGFLSKLKYKSLRAKNLLLTGLPTVDLSHPYIKHASSNFAYGPESFARLLQERYLGTILSLCTSGELQTVTIAGLNNKSDIAFVQNFLANVENKHVGGSLRGLSTRL